MKFIVVGAAGFIGSNLCEKLLILKHSVIGIDSLEYGNLKNIAKFKNHKSFKFYHKDIVKSNILDEVKGDILVHLASQKIPRYDNSLRTLTENDTMTNLVIGKCIKENIKLVFASTSDVYGKNPNLPFTETSNLVLGPTNIKRWAYAASKIFSEHKIIANHESKKLDYTIVRFFGSYWENQNLTWWGGPQSVFIKKAINNEAIEIHGDGSQTRTFTYVKDTVDALIKCCISEKAKNEIFNIAGHAKEEVRIIELAEIIWKIVRGEDQPKLKFIPYSSFGKYEDVIRRVPSIEKITKILDFNPKYSLKEGLTKTIQWQREIT